VNDFIAQPSKLKETHRQSRRSYRSYTSRLSGRTLQQELTHYCVAVLSLVSVNLLEHQPNLPDLANQRDQFFPEKQCQAMNELTTAPAIAL